MAELRTVDFQAPFIDIANKALLYNHYHPQRKRVNEELSSAWRKRHEGYQHENMPKLPKTRCEVSICALAGFCLHSDHGRRVMQLVSQVERALQAHNSFGLLKKDTQPRKLYNAACLVLRFGRPDADEPTDLVLWLHWGYCNLNSSLFSVLELNFVQIHPQAILTGTTDRCILSADTPPYPITLWEAFWSVDMGAPLDIEVWALSKRRDRVSQFVPSNVYVERTDCRRELARPGQLIPYGRLPVRPFRRPRPQRQRGDVEEDPVYHEVDPHGAGDEDAGGALANWLPEQLALAAVLDSMEWDVDESDVAEDEEAGDDGREVAEAQADALEQPHREEVGAGGLEAGADGDPEAIVAVNDADSSGPDDSSGDEGDGPDRGDPGPLPPEGAEGKGRGKGRGKHARHAPYQLWEVFDRHNVKRGIILLNTGDESLDAHCSSCGLRVNKKYRANPRRPDTGPQGRPVGTLASLLTRKCRGLAAHRAKFGAHKLTLRRRKRGRRWAAANIPSVLTHERPCRLGEGDEPDLMC